MRAGDVVVCTTRVVTAKSSGLVVLLSPPELATVIAANARYVTIALPNHQVVFICTEYVGAYVEVVSRAKAMPSKHYSNVINAAATSGNLSWAIEE